MKLLPESLSNLIYEQIVQYVIIFRAYMITVVMSHKTENWLLVKWNEGGQSVVYIKSVLSPLNKVLTPGEKLSVNWQGEPKAATLIARAYERDQLEPKPEPVVKTDRCPTPEDEGDFSASGSSWVPSADEALSGDSYTETSKRVKLEKSTRQYMNRRNSKKVLTPSHNANAVMPIPKQMENPNSKKKVVGRKRTHNNCSNQYNKTLPDSTKINNTNADAGKHMVKIDVRELEEIGNSFRLLFKMINDLKHPCLTTINETKDTEINETPTVQGNETAVVTNDTCDEPEEYEENDELNRSDDNVLITNKYDKAYTRKASPGASKDEWIPIGSGKTLIHVDQFKKVNWKSYTIATRTLLLAVFPRRILATHSLTGKRSPAFQNKPAKMCLDPKIVSDVIMEIMDRFDVKENLVRSIITTKCADECKMLKMRKKKTTPGNNRENEPPTPELKETKANNVK